MIAQVCHGCHQWWCHNAGNPRHFVYITRYCPTCLDKQPKMRA